MRDSMPGLARGPPQPQNHPDSATTLDPAAISFGHWFPLLAVGQPREVSCFPELSDTALQASEAHGPVALGNRTWAPLGPPSSEAFPP